MTKIDELMTRPVVTCRPGDTLDRVVALMIDHDCGVLPVIGADGHVAGMITDRDICLAAYREAVPLSGLRAERAMSTRIIAARPKDSLESVEKLMADNRIRRVPVIDDRGHPIGIVSFDDIVRAASRDHRDDAHVIDTAAAICAPRRERVRMQWPVSTR